MSVPFAGRNSIRVRALLVGERIDTKALESVESLAITPLLLRAGDHGAAAIFRYGAVVLFDLSPVEEVSFLSYLRPLVSDILAEPETEEAEIRVDRNAGERAYNAIIWLRSTEVERLQIVADVLARSVVLARYEKTIAAAFDRVEPHAESMQHATVGRRHAKELLRHIGSTLLIQHKMVGRVEVEEKPDLLWEHVDLERLYYRMADEYELKERHRALDRKALVISRTAETLLSLLQNRLSLRVEWYIVILILFEILLTLWEMFFRH